MDKKLMINTGKWVLMVLFMAVNITFYLLNGTRLNLILATLVSLYSVFDFFYSLSGKKMGSGLKLYLFSFYLLAILSLFIAIRSILAGNIRSALASLLLIGGDIAVILYFVHRRTHSIR